MTPIRASPLLADFVMHLSVQAGKFLTRQGTSLFYTLRRTLSSSLPASREGARRIVSEGSHEL